MNNINKSQAKGVLKEFCVVISAAYHGSMSSIQITNDNNVNSMLLFIAAWVLTKLGLEGIKKTHTT